MDRWGYREAERQAAIEAEEREESERPIVRPASPVNARHCRECGSAGLVLDARKRLRAVRRRLQCKRCPSRWVTYEMADRDMTDSQWAALDAPSPEEPEVWSG